MKNLIFICVFYNPDYIKLLFLLLESIHLYGKLNDDTDILIYTNTEFAEIIKQCPWLNNKLKFHINDTYDTILKACCSRLSLFNIPIVQDYARILYLDTDILVKSDINPVFNVAQKDLIYAMEEGNIDWEAGWGWQLFRQENNLDKYDDKTAFNSGILLFNNCQTIRNLFNDIKQHMINDPNYYFYDQPFIVYNTMTQNLHDNKALKEYVLLNDVNWNFNCWHAFSDKTLIHFIGTPGNYGGKSERMIQYLDELKTRIPANI